MDGAVHLLIPLLKMATQRRYDEFIAKKLDPATALEVLSKKMTIK